MKLWIFSDLHIAQCDWDLPADQPDCDVIIAAGDIHFASDAVVWLAERSQGRPVIYVPGNHEWYTHQRFFSVESELAKARALAEETSVHLLLDQSVVIDRVRYLGSTLWTDYALYANPSVGMRLAQTALSDHRLIYPRDDGQVFTPDDALALHNRSRAWLTKEIGRDDEELRATVVVTHHLPHPLSIDRKYDGDPLNVAFASNLAHLVEQSGVDLWIHGHTHSSCDYFAGSTRVVCNPKGYGPRRSSREIENPAFDARYVVELTS